MAPSLERGAGDSSKLYPSLRHSVDPVWLIGTVAVSIASSVVWRLRLDQRNVRSFFVWKLISELYVAITERCVMRREEVRVDNNCATQQCRRVTSSVHTVRSPRS